MGLSEPRKRIKLSHDPRNLQWSDNTSSFGARIMQSSGWKPGTALGASSMPAHEATAAKVRVSVKDDMLGLGASLKSKSAEHQRTGLDAFQGLLGRLNAKGEGELKKVEEKIENKKLAMFALGRWGGMVFVPGGLLVQDDPTKQLSQKEENQESKAKAKAKADMERNQSDSEADSARARKPEKKRKRAGETPEERAQRKAEKKQRKEDRRIHREAKRLKKSQNESSVSTPVSETTELTETSTGASTPLQIPEVNLSSVTQERLQNGRHILRGRNIQAKRMAFTDSKGLDQIFMRQRQQQTA